MFDAADSEPESDRDGGDSDGRSGNDLVEWCLMLSGGPVLVTSGPTPVRLGGPVAGGG